MTHEQEPRRSRRWVSLATWLPAVVLVPVTLVVAVEVSRSDPTEPMDDVLPLEPGTTWVYDVFDHGEPSGSRVRQVLGQGQILDGDGLQEVVRLSSSYDDYPGVGPRSDQIYVGVEGDQLLQYAVITRSQTYDVAPPAPAYELPAEEGTSWSYDGAVGSSPFAFEVEVTDRGEVEVAGHAFTDCTEWTTVIDVENPEVEGATEVLQEWTCPGIGVVRYTDTYEAGGVDVTEELRAFHSPESTWTADDADPATNSETTVQPDEVSTAGFDQGRSFAVPHGRLSRDLAWTEARDATSRQSPASDGETTVIGEHDGLVDARAVDTGERLWQVSLPPPIVAAPVIAGDMVLVADGRKNLWALALSDGSARWVHRFDDVVSAVPVVTEDLVVAPVDDGSVVALGLADGEEAWTGDLAGRARTAPALHEDRVVVGDDSGSITAFDLETGDSAWSVALQDGLEQGPAVADGRVLAVDTNGVLASYDAEVGELQWQTRGDFPSQPLAANGESVVTVGDDGLIESYDLADGSRQWARTVRDVDVAPAVVGDEVVLLAEEGRVTVLAMADGRTRDQWDLPRPTPVNSFLIRTDPALVGDSLAIRVELISGDFSAVTYAYSVRGGKVTGVSPRTQRRSFVLPVSALPVRDGSAVYALDVNGDLYRGAGQGDPVHLGRGIMPPVGLAAADGIVVVPDGDRVRALDGGDGSELWSVPSADATVFSLPAIGEDSVFVPLHDLGLTAVDRDTGRNRWVVRLPGASGYTTPLALPGGDVAHAGNGLARFEGATGEEVWRIGGDLANAVGHGPLNLADGRLHVAVVSPDPAQPTGERTRVVAVDALSGRVAWEHDLNGVGSGIGPVAGDGAVVVVDATGVASVLDGATGKERWSFRLATVPAGPPVVHDGVVSLIERGRPEELLQRDFRIVHLDLATGAFLGSYYEPPNGNDSVLPTVGSAHDGTLLIPTTNDVGQVVLMLEPRR